MVVVGMMWSRWQRGDGGLLRSFWWRASLEMSQSGPCERIRRRLVFRLPGGETSLRSLATGNLAV